MRGLRDEEQLKRSLFDEIEGVECSFPSDKPRNRIYAEITNKAGMILYQMGVKLPDECWPAEVRETIARELRNAEKALNTVEIEAAKLAKQESDSCNEKNKEI